MHFGRQYFCYTDQVILDIGISGYLLLWPLYKSLYMLNVRELRKCCFSLHESSANILTQLLFSEYFSQSDALPEGPEPLVDPTRSIKRGECSIVRSPPPVPVSHQSDAHIPTYITVSSLPLTTLSFTRRLSLPHSTRCPTLFTHLPFHVKLCCQISADRLSTKTNASRRNEN